MENHANETIRKEAQIKTDTNIGQLSRYQLFENKNKLKHT